MYPSGITLRKSGFDFGVIFAGLLCLSRFNASAASGDALLNPGNFSSLGAFESSTNVIVDLTTGQMSGGATFAGVNVTQAGTSLLVFAFSSFKLNAGHALTFTNDGYGTRAVALLSQNDMNVGGIIDASGHFGITATSASTPGTGGPGGGNGNNNSGQSGLGFGGSGGAGTFSTPGGGGAGYGGVGGYGGGGNSDGKGLGGNTYNTDLASQLMGGSGGGAGGYVGAGTWGTGGGGGGGLQLGALGTILISGTVSSTGGGGGRPTSTFGNGGGGGGGSGGGILIQGGRVTLSASATVSVRGGNGGSSGIANADYGGGGGGGGRVYIVYRSEGFTNGTINLNGGTGGYGGAGFPSNAINTGTNGSAGTIFFGQNDSVPSTLLALKAIAGSRVVVSWPASAASYSLETSSLLGAGASWTPLSTQIFAIGNDLVRTNTTTGNAFFRLRKP